ncbi:MAG: TonB-dependent receptor, partial [Steroidobacteraceae bacterium]
DMLRGKILFKASDALSIKLSGDYTDKDDREGAEFINLEGAPTQLGVAIGGTPSPGFYKSANDSDAQLHLEQAGGELRIDLDVGGTTLSSISGYRWSKLEARGSDLDTVDLPFQHDNYTEASNSYSQELQAVSDKTGPLTWIAGLYYFREGGDNTFNVFGQAIDASVGVPSGPNVGTLDGGAALNAKADVTTESFAPYLEGSYQLTDQLQLTLGGRYTWENKKLEENRVFLTGVVPGQQVPLFPPDGDRKLKFEKFSPKVSLNWKPISDVLLYVTYSRGFKSGGFNTPAFTPLVDSVEPETLDAYELGWKTEFGTVRFNGSVFYYDFKDLQIQRTDQTSGGTRVENAAAAKIYGIETDITWALTTAFELGVGGGLLQSEYKDYLGDAYVPAFSTQGCIAAGGVGSGNPACLGYAVEARDFSGDTLAQAPEASAYVRAQYEIPLPDAMGVLHANALYSYTDRYFYNPEHSLAEPSKNLVSASVSWVSEGERFQLTAFGDNLLDEEYDILKVRQGTGGWHVPALPRTWGVKLAANF